MVAFNLKREIRLLASESLPRILLRTRSTSSIISGEDRSVILPSRNNRINFRGLPPQKEETKIFVSTTTRCFSNGALSSGIGNEEIYIVSRISRGANFSGHFTVSFIESGIKVSFFDFFKKIQPFFHRQLENRLPNLIIAKRDLRHNYSSFQMDYNRTANCGASGEKSREKILRTEELSRPVPASSCLAKPGWEPPHEKKWGQAFPINNWKQNGIME